MREFFEQALDEREFEATCESIEQAERRTIQRTLLLMVSFFGSKNPETLRKHESES